MMIRVERKEGLQPYQETWQAMLDYTLQRDEQSPDMLWLLEHFPVYTLGQAGKREHLLNVRDIPVEQTDRGGQVTYHGPGQLVVYVLWDLRRAGYFIKEYVWRLEEALIMTLKSLGVVQAQRKPSAPGVYVPNALGELEKIAALGVKVKQGRTYHGLSLNLDMDLRPFSDINPCGYAGLRTIDLASLGLFPEKRLVEDILVDHLQRLLARSE